MYIRSFIAILTLFSISVLAADETVTRQENSLKQVYGKHLMTEQERTKQRLKMHVATTANNTKMFDQRQTVLLNPPQQAHVLSEMRRLLAGTQVIVTALATNDMERVTKQARLLGMQMKKKPENKLQNILPKTFMLQGKEVHMAFDRIADDAKSMKDPKHTLTQLGEALGTCTACHEMYRIEAINVNAGMGKQEM